MISDVPQLKQEDLQKSMKLIHSYLQLLKQELEYNFLHVDNSSIVGLDKSLEGVFSSIGELETSSGYWNRIRAITDDLGRVITEKLQGDIRTSINKVVNGVGTVTMDDYGIIIHNEPTEAESTWAMRLGAGGFAIASSKDANGAWNWSTFGTGEGFTASAMTTGELYAITINACTLIATNITSGTITGVTISACVLNGVTINGVTINGGVIYIGDVANGNYIEVSPNNPVKVWRNSKVVSSLGYSAIGGGNMSIYDLGGNLAFKIEPLDDGRLQIFCNSGSGVIPDPNNPGFILPNPNPQTVYWDAGRVAFKQDAAGIYGGNNTTFHPFTTINQAKYEFYDKYEVNSKVDGKMESHIWSYHFSSDKRLKENIDYINPIDMLEFAKTINLAKYNMIDNDREIIGVIAQDIMDHPIGKYFVREIPDREDGMLMVDYELLATTALGAVKSLEERLEALELKVNQLVEGE